MAIYAVGDKVPRIHPTAFIAPSASIVGDVVIHENASVWYGAVVRGDSSYAVIGAGANVQDGAIVHGRAGNPALIGVDAGIAHGAIVHGATIGDRALIANGAIVLDGAVVEADALVAAGSLVPPGMVVPAGMLAIGSPAEVKRALAGTPTEEHVINNPIRYAHLREEHFAGLRELSRDETPIP